MLLACGSCGGASSNNAVTLPEVLPSAQPPVVHAPPQGPSVQAFLDAGCRREKSADMLDCKGAHIDGIDACAQDLHLLSVSFEPPALLAECFVHSHEEGSMGRPGGVRTTGCMIPVEVRLVAALADGFVVLKSRDELKAKFAPVTSPTEAIAFAVAATGASVYARPTAPPPGMTVSVSIPQVTEAVVGADGAYHLRLFAGQVCGCSHPLSGIDVTVGRDGTVTEGTRTTIWEDPKSSGPCVD